MIKAITKKELKDPLFFPRIILILLYLIYLNLQLLSSSLSTAFWTNSFLRSYDISVPIHFTFILLIIASDSISGENLEEIFCVCNRMKFLLSKWLFLSLTLFLLQLPFLIFHSFLAGEVPFLLLAGNLLFILSMVALGVCISLLANSTLISALLILLLPEILSSIGDALNGVHLGFVNVKYLLSPEYALQSVLHDGNTLNLLPMLLFTLIALGISLLFLRKEIKKKRII